MSRAFRDAKLCPLVRARQLHIGNNLVVALSSRPVSRLSRKDKGGWCESRLVVLLGNRSADTLSDGISKSRRSGGRQPYLYWRSRGCDVRQKTYGRRAVGRVYSRQMRSKSVRWLPNEVCAWTDREGLFGKPKLKSLWLHSRRVVVHCLAFCPALLPQNWTGHWVGIRASGFPLFCFRVKFTLSLQTIVLNCAFSIHHFRAGGYSVG